MRQVLGSQGLELDSLHRHHTLGHHNLESVLELVRQLELHIEELRIAVALLLAVHIRRHMLELELAGIVPRPASARLMLSLLLRRSRTLAPRSLSSSSFHHRAHAVREEGMSSRSQVALDFAEHMDLLEDNPVQGILLEVLPLLLRICAAFREETRTLQFPKMALFVCVMRVNREGPCLSFKVD